MAEVPFVPRPMLTGGERLTERIVLKRGGRASETMPQTFEEARAHLAPQIARALADAESLPATLRGRRVIVEATVLPNYLANTHHPEALFEDTGAIAIGTRGARGVYRTRTKTTEDAPTKTYVLAVDDNTLPRIASLLAQSAPASARLRADVAKLDDIRLPTSDEVLRMGTGEVITVDGMVAMESVLHPAVDADGTPDETEMRVVWRKWTALVNSLGGRVRDDFAAHLDGMLFLPVLLPPGALSEAARFNPLRTLRPMPEVRPVLPSPLRTVGPAYPPPANQPATAGRIAVYDGGIPTGHLTLAPFTTYADLTGGSTPDPEFVAHGTLVTSAALFGQIDVGEPLSVPPAAVDVYRLFPPPPDETADVHLYWVLRRLEQHVRESKPTLAVISFGPPINVDYDGEPHLWTLSLDRLTAEVGTLFCVAVGNTGDLDAETGLNRVCVPGDVANSLGVGACTGRPPDKWSRAPYSSVGPGRPGARMSPAGVSFGGDTASEQPFRGVLPSGLLGEAEGTSFANPIAARGLGELAGLLQERTSPALLRACAVHFAERPRGKASTVAGLRSHEVGYGRFAETYLPHLSCPPETATVLYEDSLRRGESVTVRVPLPDDALDAVPSRRVDVRWTLAFIAPLEPNNPVEYARRGIEIYFRPHAEKFNMSLDGHEPILVNRRVDPKLYDFLVAQGRVPSDRPATRAKSGYAPENERREDGKWETILRGDDRIQADGLYRPAFDLHLLSRDHGALVNEADDLPYVMLVTVTAPRGIPLYDRVRAGAPVLTPLMLSLPVPVGIAT